MIEPSLYSLIDTYRLHSWKTDVNSSSNILVVCNFFSQVSLLRVASQARCCWRGRRRPRKCLHCSPNCRRSCPRGSRRYTVRRSGTRTAWTKSSMSWPTCVLWTRYSPVCLHYMSVYFSVCLFGLYLNMSVYFMSVCLHYICMSVYFMSVCFIISVYVCTLCLFTLYLYMSVYFMLSVYIISVYVCLLDVCLFTLYLCMSVCFMSVCLHCIRLSTYLSTWCLFTLYLYMPVYFMSVLSQYICISLSTLCLSVSLYLYMFVYFMSVYIVSVYVWIYVSVSLYVCLSDVFSFYIKSVYVCLLYVCLFVL